jgi:quercetin dioxygenase-like cupin family protein
MKQVSEIVEKRWGKEIIFSNNSLYCGKLLCFNKGSQFSMHFHIKKDETWYVNSGKIKVSWIDTVTAEVIEDTLEVGDVWRNEPGLPHQVTALEDSVIFEVSTQHFDDDSYRVMPGDSQK